MLTHPETGVQNLRILRKSLKGYAPAWRLYSLKFSRILVKFSALEALYPYLCTDGVKFGVDDSSTPNFTPSVESVAPEGKKPQNCYLSNLNTVDLRCAQLLPVIDFTGRECMLNVLPLGGVLSMIPTVLGRPFVKLFALCYRTVVHACMSVLSVCHVCLSV